MGALKFLGILIVFAILESCSNQDQELQNALNNPDPISEDTEKAVSEKAVSVKDEKASNPKDTAITKLKVAKVKKATNFVEHPANITNLDYSLIDLLISQGGSYQELLDLGFTPQEIYEHRHSDLDTLYGLTYHGGLIFYYDTLTGDGLVASPIDQGDAKWGYDGAMIGTTHRYVGSGLKNSYEMLSHEHSELCAADICDTLHLNGYDDWYLPSEEELKQMYTHLYLKGLGNISGNYWSSSEGSENWAIGLDAGFHKDGSTYITSKNSKYHVRAIRSF